MLSYCMRFDERIAFFHRNACKSRQRKRKLRERERGLMNTKSMSGNYKRTRDQGKTRVPANSVFPVYEGKLRSNEVTAGTHSPRER